MPPPVPPSVKLGRMMIGRPISSQRRAGLVQVVDDAARGDVEADLQHRLLERVALLGLGDDVCVGADHLDAELLEDSPPGEVHRRVQARLAAERGQQRVGPLLLDDLLRRTAR